MRLRPLRLERNDPALFTSTKIVMSAVISIQWFKLFLAKYVIERLTQAWLAQLFFIVHGPHALSAKISKSIEVPIRSRSAQKILPSCLDKWVFCEYTCGFKTTTVW